MSSVYRVTRVECPYHWLAEGDLCFHFGEYTSGGGWGASDTNQWISNLKKKPTATPAELSWKRRAVRYWADILRQLLPPHNVAKGFTFVPMPGSKPVGHVEYDPRMQLVLDQWSQGVDGVDIREVLRQTVERAAQHGDGPRLTPPQICESLTIDESVLKKPLQPTVIVMDDVFTLGASFKAAQSMLGQLPGVQSVQGIFLAKTVWPSPFAPLDEDDDF